MIVGMSHDAQENRSIPLWFKVSYTTFVCVLVPVYWAEYGPANFLWGSDLALLATLVAAWTANRLLVSMMTVGVLLPEVGWIVLFFYQLVAGSAPTGMAETYYMFDASIPIFVRALSFYHIVLPLLLIWMVIRLGYHPKAVYFQTLLAWIVLPVCYVFTDPTSNINWVFGLGQEPQTWMPGPVYVGLLMVLFPIFVYLPTHLLLSRLAGIVEA